MNISFPQKQQVSYASADDNKSTSSVEKPKKNNVLESLMKQKENLMESKKQLMQKASEKGDSISTIKDSIKSIDEQIEQIDNEISKIQLEDQRKALGAEDKEKENKKTKKTTDNEDLSSNIVSLSNNQSQVNKLLSQKTSISGEVRVLESEIKLDMARGVDPVAKQKRVTQLKNNLEDIGEKVSDKIADEEDKTSHSNNSVNIESKQNVYIMQMKKKAEKSIKVYTNNLDDNQDYNGDKFDNLA